MRVYLIHQPQTGLCIQYTIFRANLQLKFSDKIYQPALLTIDLKISYCLKNRASSILENFSFSTIEFMHGVSLPIVN